VADLEALYRQRCETPSDIYLHLPRLVAIVEELDARHVIELGTRTGVSTVAFLHALERTGGRLTSVDLEPKPDIGDWPHWTHIQGDDLNPAVVSTLDPADVVFIDTSHTYEHTARELRVYRHLAKVIVCHDTRLLRPLGAPSRPKYPVRVAVEEFCDEEGLEWREFTDCFGLGVIRVG
jgi:cephalosporin hydroxylase